MTRVAVLGAGLMGAPMARRLAEAGHAVAVWNRTRKKAEGLGASIANTPGDAVEGAEVVITMLSDGPAVEQTMREALPAAAPGTIWAQTSTVGLPASERLSALAGERDLVHVDAPVLGTRKPAEDGQLVVLAAGPGNVRPRCEEVFAAFSRATHWVGDAPPAGQALKLVVNAWIMNTMANLGETVALAQALGIEPQRFLDAIAGGNMDMPYAHLKSAAMLSGDLEPSFRLALAHKDVGLIVEGAEQAGLEVPVARTTAAQMARAIELGHGDEDMAATYFASLPGE
jgi:3-hydroxyisobutyrate dehydrogenase